MARRQSTVARMGIFDEIKGAFSADDAQAIDESREVLMPHRLGPSTH